MKRTLSAVGNLLPLLTLLVAAADGAALPAGLAPQPDGRIIGGDSIHIDALPWQISLQRHGGHSCGGAIYNARIVITAAHCLPPNLTPENVRIRAGSSYRYTGGCLVGVSHFKVHEQYNAKTKENDIAVVRLTTSLEMGDNIKSIPLATVSPAHDSAALVSGWGYTAYEGRMSNRLHYADIKIIGRAECRGPAYGYGDKIKPSMICAAASNKDACQGDSGGPLVVNGQLAGIVSWGKQCGLVQYPGVYADVAVLSKWLLQAIEQMQALM